MTKKAKREIRTWRVGEVGTEGTRRVEAGGIIQIGWSQRPQDRRPDGSKWPRRKFQHDRLKPLVGRIVYFADNDSGYIAVSHVEWLQNGKAAAGRSLCHIHFDLTGTAL